MTAQNPDYRDEVLDEVMFELQRQDGKWGEQNHPNVDRVLIERQGSCTPQRMAEEYGILTAGRAKWLTDLRANQGQVTYAHILIEEVAEAIEAATLHDQFALAHGEPPRHNNDLRKELIQVAAVAVAWIKKLARDEKKLEAAHA